MSILSALYHLLIGPLELLFEVIFSFANRVIDNPGLAIIFLSLAVNFLVLPLYKRADAMQEEARETEAKLNHWVTHIKKNFKGDERFMMLQTYYRQNNYKPTDALKGSLSLLLEVPFFMAAYNFLSRLQLLQGVSFGPIKDLGAPDSMLVIAGITIHVLPILMTAINLISGVIYTKGFPLKSKIQLYGMALIFLVLLYESPSGLVFYWTLNNLFSLVKNVFYKLKNPKFVLGILSSAVGAGLLAGVLFWFPMPTVHRQAAVIALAVLLQLPLAACFVGKKRQKKTVTMTKGNRFAFYAGCVFTTIVTGLLIPSAVIKASPEEFISTVTMSSPLLYVLNALLLAAGTFIVWFGIFYMLANPAGKKTMGLGMWLLSGIAVVNYMFFGTDYGNLSPTLKYDITPAFAGKTQLLNLLILVAVIGLLYLIWKKKFELVKVVYLAAGIAMLGMSVINVQAIHSVSGEVTRNLETSHQEQAKIPLSKTGKNVVVLMMDRAIGGHIPYIFNEKPELKEQFAGFTYYPNTISFGITTNFGVPAVFGGYQYTPEEMNKRDDMLLADKHNEALRVMPVLFDEHDYKVTVCDPAYAGYRWIPDLSIYEDHPDINAYITLGKFDHNEAETAKQIQTLLNRNFFCYSLFRIAPVCAQSVLYQDGLYNEPDVYVQDSGTVQVTHSTSRASGINGAFMKAYEVLRNLPAITEITSEEENTFLIMCNDTTHEPMLLQEPQYEPAAKIDNTQYDADHADRFVLDGRQLKMENENQVTHYHANVAAMLQLGRWLDYLRENGVYDNTRIIIVSDHGRGLGQFDDMVYDSVDLMLLNPLLMVKDFNSREFTTDRTFMTNGDVPTLATHGLIENPLNPFTGNPINSDAKTAEAQHILFSEEYDITVNNGTTFLPGQWYSVHDDIFDMENWNRME